MKIAKITPNIEYLMESTGECITNVIQDLSKRGYSCQLDEEWNIIVVTSATPDLREIEEICKKENEDHDENIVNLEPIVIGN